jgi:DNA-directed RNA polymerase specialized sigma24 family protein
MDERADALEHLYRSRHAGFRNALVAVVGTSDAARDVVEEAFARAYATRGQLRDPQAVEAWVWRIALRTAFEHRGAGWSPVDEDDLGTFVEPQRDHALAAALRALAPRRRLLRRFRRRGQRSVQSSRPKGVTDEFARPSG